MKSYFSQFLQKERPRTVSRYKSLLEHVERSCEKKLLTLCGEEKRCGWDESRCNTNPQIGGTSSTVNERRQKSLRERERPKHFRGSLTNLPSLHLLLNFDVSTRHESESSIVAESETENVSDLSGDRVH